MPSIAQIAAKALNAVAKAIPDAIHAATLTRTTQGAYNVTTGAYAVTTATQTGRAVFANEKPIADVFPQYIAGPSDQLVLLEGFASCPENAVLSVAGRTLTVMQTQDIAAAGSLFYIVGR